jgi:hypothetical protein
MTRSVRAVRRIGVGLLVLVALTLVVGFAVVRDVSIASLLGVGVSAVLFVCSIVIVLLRRRDDAGLRDASLAYYLNPPIANVAMAVVYSVMAIGTVAFGVALVSVGTTIGWGLVLSGAAGLVFVAFEVWIARRPFHDGEPE